MDEEEIHYPEVYDMRKICENMINTIERIYPDDFKQTLSRYVRFSANKRDYNKLMIKKKKQ
jgi:hypothetical protein